MVTLACFHPFLYHCFRTIAAKLFMRPIWPLIQDSRCSEKNKFVRGTKKPYLLGSDGIELQVIACCTKEMTTVPRIQLNQLFSFLSMSLVTLRNAIYFRQTFVRLVIRKNSTIFVSFCHPLSSETSH